MSPTCCANRGAEILVNYLPVGSQQATEFYAEACLESGVSLVNCIPVFIVSDPPVGPASSPMPAFPASATTSKPRSARPSPIARWPGSSPTAACASTRTYQLNTGGNTDFLNMLNRDRLASKKISKTEAVQSQLDVPLERDQIHIGPSDFIPFQKDNKVCFLRIEGTGFGGVPMHLELRLSVEDSPNSAGVVVDAIRCCKLARDAGLAGPIEPVCAWTMKHPPRQMLDAERSWHLKNSSMRPHRASASRCEAGNRCRDN